MSVRRAHRGRRRQTETQADPKATHPHCNNKTQQDDKSQNQWTPPDVATMGGDTSWQQQGCTPGGPSSLFAACKLRARVSLPQSKEVRLVVRQLGAQPQNLKNVSSRRGRGCRMRWPRGRSRWHRRCSRWHMCGCVHRGGSLKCVQEIHGGSTRSWHVDVHGYRRRSRHWRRSCCGRCRCCCRLCSTLLRLLRRLDVKAIAGPILHATALVHIEETEISILQTVQYHSRRRALQCRRHP